MIQETWKSVKIQKLSLLQWLPQVQLGPDLVLNEKYILITWATVKAKLSSDVPKVFVQTVVPSLSTLFTTI